MPIIKSKGRKDTNFGQLINYLHQQDTDREYTFTYLHNMPGMNPEDRKGIEEEFQKNEQFRKRRKNGIGVYHEVLSFHPKDSAYLQQHPEIVEDIAHKYLELRAPHAVGIAKPHQEKHHIHLHFMLSPNEKGSDASIRLSKAEFKALRRTIERYQEQQYPELSSSYVHDRDKEKYQDRTENRSPEAWGIEQRGGQLSQKQNLSKQVTETVKASKDLSDLQRRVEESGLEVYERNGILNGVVVNGRKHRIASLSKDDPGLQNLFKRYQEQERQSPAYLEKQRRKKVEIRRSVDLNRGR